MKWAVQHSMQIGDLNPQTLQLAKQLGMDYVNIWTGPDKYKDTVNTVQAAGLKKRFVVHFRNVSAPLPHFYETYLNEGYMDMYKVMRALRKVNFDGVLIGDHFPRMVGNGPLAQAYTIGYLQCLIERANEEV